MGITKHIPMKGDKMKPTTKTKIKSIAFDQGKDTMEIQLGESNVRTGKFTATGNDCEYARLFFNDYIDAKTVLKTFEQTVEAKIKGQSGGVVWISCCPIFKKFLPDQKVYIRLVDRKTIRVFTKEEKMYMDEGIDGVLHRITEMEREGKPTTGEQIIGTLFPEHGMFSPDDGINVIPGGTPGVCHKLLVVAIGHDDDDKLAEEHICRASEHVLTCKGTTTQVIFVAQKWDSLLWGKYSGRFSSLLVVLRLWKTSPVRLSS
jgi:hypothetical protein